MIRETPFFLAREGHRLFAVLHEPAGPASGRTLVFCHPLAEEKLWSHRTFVAFARELAASGHLALRFDYMGNGDSDGDFSEASVETAIADIVSAIDWLRERSGRHRTTLVGLRFGATVAALVAERTPGIDELVLWAPIVDGARYMQELLRINVATQSAVYREIRHDRAQLVEQMRGGSAVNVDGYQLTLALFEQSSAIRLDASPKTFRGRCLVVQIDRADATPSAELRDLASSYADGALQLVDEEPLWKELPRSFLNGSPRLSAVTREWFDKGRAVTPGSTLPQEPSEQ